MNQPNSIGPWWSCDTTLAKEDQDRWHLWVVTWNRSDDYEGWNATHLETGDCIRVAELPEYFDWLPCEPPSDVESAAPELLEACEAMLDEYEAGKPIPAFEVRELCRAAIAKAKGDQ